MEILKIGVVFGVVLMSMVLHELAHGAVAYALGDETAKRQGRLSLNPLRHLDWFSSILLPLLLYVSGGPVFGGAKPVPINARNLKFREWGMALVALAGPMTNLVLAYLAFVVGEKTGILYQTSFLAMIFRQMVMVNLGFMVFNLIPVPPLDGSRVLYALMPDEIRVIMEKMERYGFIVMLVLVVVFSDLLGDFMIGATTQILELFIWSIG